jgi:hypothetical protein
MIRALNQAAMVSRTGPPEANAGKADAGQTVDAMKLLVVSYCGKTIHAKSLDPPCHWTDGASICMDMYSAWIEFLGNEVAESNVRDVCMYCFATS